MPSIIPPTPEEIQKNKERFISLVESIQREGSNKELLLKKLQSSDFFTAPASTKFHNDFEGGLCKHSLCVYDTLVTLIKSFGLEGAYSEDTLKIIALFHDIAKMNFYDPDVHNYKQYIDNGSKFDSIGNFEWREERGYKVKPFENRFLYGTHEENSVFMIRTFFPLTVEEEIAVLHHHAGADKMMTYNDRNEQSAITSRFPLVALLHMADYCATYVFESDACQSLIDYINSQKDKEDTDEQDSEGTTDQVSPSTNS